MKKPFYILLLLTALFSPLTTVSAENQFLITPNGAEYRDLVSGSGGTAATGDIATIHFVGWLDEGGRQGKQFYNSRRQGNPVSFVIGTDRVMPGWNEGVIGMQPGGKRLLKLPPALGYGQRSIEDVVPPNARLIFVIELLDLEKR